MANPFDDVVPKAKGNPFDSVTPKTESNPFDSVTEAAAPEEKPSALKEVGKLGLRAHVGLVEGLTRAVEGAATFAESLVNPQGETPPQYKNLGLPSRAGYKNVLGVEVPKTQEDYAREKAGEARRQKYGGFSNPVTETTSNILKNISSGMGEVSRQLQETRKESAIAPSKKFAESVPGKVLSVAEEFTPLLGQMVASGGNPFLLGSMAGFSHLAESKESYKQLHPGATDTEALGHAAPGAVAMGAFFTAFGGITEAGGKVLAKWFPNAFGKTFEGLTNYGVKEATRDIVKAEITDIPAMVAQNILVGKIDSAQGVRPYSVADEAKWETMLTNALTVLAFKGVGIPSRRKAAREAKPFEGVFAEAKTKLEDPNTPEEQKVQMTLHVAEALHQMGKGRMARDFVQASMDHMKRVNLRAQIDKQKVATGESGIGKQEEVDAQVKEEVQKTPVPKEWGEKDLAAMQGKGEPLSWPRKVEKAEELPVGAKAPVVTKPKPESSKKSEAPTGGAEQAPPKKANLVPALRLPSGEEVLGEVGDTHKQIGEKIGLTEVPEEYRGFFDPETNDFISDRKQAAELAGVPTARAGKLHSTDLARAAGEPLIHILDSNPNIGIAEHQGKLEIRQLRNPDFLITGSVDERGNVTLDNLNNIGNKENLKDVKTWLAEAGYKLKVGKEEKVEAKKPEVKKETPKKEKVSKKKIADELEALEDKIFTAELRKDRGELSETEVKELDANKKKYVELKTGRQVESELSLEKSRTLTDKEIKDLDVLRPAVRTSDGEVIAGKVSTSFMDTDIHPTLAKNLIDKLFHKKENETVAERLERQKNLVELKDKITWGYQTPDGKFMTRQEAIAKVEKESTDTNGNIIPGSVFDAYVADQMKYNTEYKGWSRTKVIEDIRKKGLESISYLTAKGIIGSEFSLEKETKEPFYSKLEKVIEEKFPGKVDSKTALQLVESWQKKGEFTADELEQSGLKEFLASEERITKQDVLDFLKEQQTEFKDVILGEKDTETHFSQYTEPGAKKGSYREMFVTALTNKITPEYRTQIKRVQELTKQQNQIETEFGTNSREYRNASMQTNMAREMLRKAGNYWSDGHSQYSDIQNPVVRIRFNERESDGKRILFIEEIQGPSEANQEKMPDYLHKRIYDIGVKRILSYAKENGFDGVAWTSGEMQAKRYDLSKQIKEIGWNKDSEDRIVELDITTHDGEVISKNVSFAELPDYVGKDMAKKILESKKDTDHYTGLDLKVGGEGLKRLYDQTIPAMFKKYGKGGVEETKISTTHGLSEQKYKGPTYTADQLFDLANKADSASTTTDLRHAATEIKEGTSTFEDAANRWFSISDARYLGGEMEQVETSESVSFTPITEKTPSAYAKFSLEKEPGKLREGEKVEVSPRPGVLSDPEEVTRRLEKVRSDISRIIGREVPEGTVSHVPDFKNEPVEKISDALDKKILWFKINDYEVLKGLQGSILPSDPDVILINSDTRNPHVAIFGHELMHDIQRNHPEIYEAFAKVVWEQATELEPYIQQHPYSFVKGIGKTRDISKEFVNDAFGMALTKEKTWNRLAIERPNVFMKVIQPVLDMIQKIKDLFTEPTAMKKVEKQFKDFALIEEAAVRSLDAYLTAKGIEKYKPVYDGKGGVSEFRLSKERYTTKDIRTMLMLKRHLGELYVLPKGLQDQLAGKSVDLESPEFSIENAIKTLKEEKTRTGEGVSDAIKFLVYPRWGVPDGAKTRWDKYQGQQAILRDSLAEKFKGIQKELRKEPLESWIAYNDALRSGGEIPEQWREYNAIGKAMADAVWEKIVDVRPDLAIYKRDAHNTITLHFLFGDEAEVNEKKPFYGLTKALQGDKSFLKHYSGKTVSEILEAGGKLRDTDPISTMVRTLDAEAKFAASAVAIRDGVQSGTWRFVPEGKQLPEGYAFADDRLFEIHKKLLFPPPGWDVLGPDGKKITTAPFEDKANAEQLAKENMGRVVPGGGAEFIKSIVVIPEEGGEPMYFPNRELAKDYQTQFGGKIKVQLGRETTAMAGKWAMPKDEARYVNNLLSVDKFRQNEFADWIFRVRNMTVSMELFSAFHATTITQEMFACKLGLIASKVLNMDFSGAMREIKNPGNSLFLGKLTRAFMKDPVGFENNPEIQTQLRRYLGDQAADFSRAVVDLYNAGLIMRQDPNLKWGEKQGFMGKLFGVDTKQTGIELTKEGHYIVGGFKIPIDVAKGVQNLLFDHYIPNAKFSIAMLTYLNDLRQFRPRLERGEVTREQLAREAVAYTEKRFGEVNWEKFGFNKMYASILRFLFRAPMWKGGTVAAYASSIQGIGRQYKLIKDTPRGEAIPIDKDLAWFPGFLAAHIVTSMIIGYGAAWVTGKDELKPEKLFDYFFPKIGVMYELATGEKKYNRVSQPGYGTEAIKLAHSVMTDPMYFPTSYIAGGLNSYFGKLGEVHKNQDFFGNQIYSEDDPIYKRWADKALHLMPLPFGVATFTQSQRMNEGPEKWIYMTGLIQKAPAWASQSKAEAKMTEYLSGYGARGGFTKEEAEDNKFRREIVAEVRKGNIKSFEDFPPEMQDKMKKMNPERLQKIVQNAAKLPIASAFAKLTRAHHAENVWDLMTVQEKKDTAEAMIKHIESKYKKAQYDAEKLEAERKRLDPILEEIKAMFPQEEPETKPEPRVKIEERDRQRAEAEEEDDLEE